MVIVASAFASGLLCFIIGYIIGRAGGWQDGYNQRSDECRMRRCMKGIR